MVPAASTRLTDRRIDGVPVYEYVPRADGPPVGLLRFDVTELPERAPAHDHAHAHDFLVLTYFERGGGTISLGDRHWPVAAGDAFVIAPGEVVRLGEHGHDADTEGWGMFFAAEIISTGILGGSLGWSTHPLLFPFLGRTASGAQRLRVPRGERAAWSRHAAAIELELNHPRDASTEAVLAHLTLLLVSVSRIAVDLGDDLRLRQEPLLAAVFEFIEQHYAEPISLADIAAHVALTPGHLTTVIRRKTGRTAQRWIAERRMTEARRLLRETDLSIESIAGRIGYRDPSFFIKQFRREHADTPAAWRLRTRRSLRPAFSGTQSK